MKLSRGSCNTSSALAVVVSVNTADDTHMACVASRATLLPPKFERHEVVCLSTAVRAGQLAYAAAEVARPAGMHRLKLEANTGRRCTS